LVLFITITTKPRVRVVLWYIDAKVHWHIGLKYNWDGTISDRWDYKLGRWGSVKPRVYSGHPNK